jgi:hypothetical protein
MPSATLTGDAREGGRSFQYGANGRQSSGREMRQQVTKDLFAYWSELRGARAAPDRADIDPMAIRQILADTFIMEVAADGFFPMRLSGTRLNALWLHEQKGESFVDLWREEDRDAISAALFTVIDDASPVVGGVRTHAPGDARLDLELVLLPLRHFGKTHSRILGALSPAHQPEWLGVIPVGPLELVSLRVIDADAMRQASENIRGFASGTSARRRPHLVVYQGDKA